MDLTLSPLLNLALGAAASAGSAAMREDRSLPPAPEPPPPPAPEDAALNFATSSSGGAEPAKVESPCGGTMANSNYMIRQRGSETRWQATR